MYSSDFTDFLVFISTLVAVVIAAVLLCVGLVNSYQLVVDKPACEAYGLMSKQKTFFSLGTSCLVERNGEWVKYDVAVGKKQEITIKNK